MTKKLTPEDLRLWQLNTKDVKLLEKNLKPTKVFQEPKLPKKQVVLKRHIEKKGVLLKSVLPSLGRKELRRLKIEARFDMHGLRFEKGYEALEEFLLRAQEKGIKTVLIITGKGALTAENTFRHQVPRWLKETALRHLITSFHHPAKLQDGGEGALYVDVRRKINFMKDKE